MELLLEQTETCIVNNRVHDQDFVYHSLLQLYYTVVFTIWK